MHKMLGLALLAGAAAHVLIFAPVPPLLKAFAALALTGFVPGALLVELLVGRSAARPTPWERFVYSAGAGYTCMVAMTLSLSYLPGGLLRGQVLLAFDLLIAALALVLFIAHRADMRRASTPDVEGPVAVSPAPAGRWLAAALVTLVVVGSFFRFTNLGYSEFQGDEARLALRAAEVIQGYENALFVHKKGPAEILLPTTIYALGDGLTEAMARLPFAVAGLVGLVAFFLLGWRLFGPVAGWISAILLAFDGYLIAFSRIVQYQSIVFLMDVLVVLIAVRVWRQPRALPRYMALGALLLATGLLAHYEAIFVLFPVSYLLWRIWREGAPLGRIARAAILPLLVGVALVGLFYLPFVRNPAFDDTYYYLTEYRMGGGSIFNHLVDFFARATLYSSTYYLITLVALTVVGLLGRYRHWRPRWVGWLFSAGLLVGLGITVAEPAWLLIGETDWVWLFFGAALGIAWFTPDFPPAERTVWLWFGAPMMVALFFTAIPNTHVYSFFIPWALLAGMVAARGWDWLRTRLSPPAARVSALAVTAVLMALFGGYQYWLFVYNDQEVLRTWPQNRPAGYWTAYDMPVEVAIFGFPHNNGWKVVDALYEEGALQGNYDTNARDVIAEWYTRGDHYCVRDDLRYFILVNPVEPSRVEETAELRINVEHGHQAYGIVHVQGNPALTIYERIEGDRSVPHLPPRTFALEEYAAHFDRTRTHPRFERTGPVAPSMIQQPAAFRFGDSIWLRGYRLESASASRGEVLEVQLYWEAIQPVAGDYKVFVQVIDMATLAKVGQSDGRPGCERHPTQDWLPGDTISDRFRAPIDPHALPGRYTLLIGMYNDAEQLGIYDAQGQPFGSQLELAEVEILP
ncbi:MAG: glycosyltransferase family 39 protein [Caldilineaceae bacterium]|nr:glycosyltransferase family 39 protein [Caldilineaceae bacterium]